MELLKVFISSFALLYKKLPKSRFRQLYVKKKTSAYQQSPPARALEVPTL